MKCPFLKEAQVKFCRASPFKKMIPRPLEHSDSERCSTREWIHCPVAHQHAKEFPNQAHCPFLQESLVHYCSASATTKFIPYNESSLSRCSNVSHRYCELYLALAHSGTSEPLAAPADRAPDERVEIAREYWIEGIRVPARVAYSTNHMWLDVSEDGYCHVGVDAFLTKVLGSMERISFVNGKSIRRPTVVLTVHDVDWQMVFPNRMLVTGSNTYLRVHPDKLVSDPYGLGWLFEGLEQESLFPEAEVALSAGLMRGTVALAWMQQEIHRLAEFIHELLSRTSPRGETLIKEGVVLWEGVVQRLEREQILQLFNAFFSPYTN